MKGSAARTLRVVAGTVVSAALVFWIVRALVAQLAEIGRHAWTVRPVLVAASFVPLACAYGLYVLLWRRLLVDLGTSLAAGSAFRVWMLSQLGKYVPGKVWGAVGRVALTARAGGDPVAAAVSIVYETALMVATGVVLALAALPLWRAGVSPQLLDRFGATAPAVVAGAILVAVLVPGTWRIAGRLAARAVHRTTGAATVVPALPLRSLPPLVLGYAATWLLTAIGFALLLVALHPVSRTELPGAGAAFVLAWAAGTIVFVAPAGLGVREALLLVYLDGLVPREVALVVVVASRAWTTAVELAGVGVALARPRAHGAGSGTDASARA